MHADLRMSTSSSFLHLRVGTHVPRVCMMCHMGSCLNVRVENKALGLAGCNEILIGHRYNLIQILGGHCYRRNLHRNAIMSRDANNVLLGKGTTKPLMAFLDNTQKMASDQLLFLALMCSHLSSQLACTRSRRRASSLGG